MDVGETIRTTAVARAKASGIFGDFMRWLDSQRATLSVAGLVAFAGPTTFFAGAVSVMETPDAFSVASLAALFLIYGGLLWLLLLCAVLYCTGMVLGIVSQEPPWPSYWHASLSLLRIPQPRRDERKSMSSKES